MALGDIFQLKVYQDYAGRIKECLNVYFYRQIAAGGDAKDLIDAFMLLNDPDIRAFQCDIIRTSVVECLNLFNVTDFYTDDFTSEALVGAHSGECLPVHDTVTFRFLRTSRDIRHGYKRYSGITESAGANGIITAADIILELNTARANLLADLVGEGTNAYEPVIVKRIRIEPDPPEFPRVRYRLPLTAEEAEYSRPTTASVNLYVTTQDTRKIR